MAKEFQLKALITGVDKLSPTLDKARKNVMGFRRKLLSSGLGKPISLDSIIRGGAIAAPFAAGAKAAIDFESSMADVKKVVDFDTPEQFKEMSDDILNMSKRMPMAAKEIAAIYAAGGQSGIAREGLSKFAEDAIKMGVAFDQSADQAGDMMAKWRASFKFDQTQVAELADKINELGNTGAATAGQISKIITAVGSQAQIAGVAGDELAALGSTIVGIGIDENVAATGLKKFFEVLGSGSSATNAQKSVFKALRMDPKQLAEGMTTDAKGTMLHVLKAISNVDASKQSAVMMQLFGATGANAVGPLLNSLDTLQANFDLVAEKTRYAGSMQREYESRAATTANAIQLFKNRIVATGVAIGDALLPAVNSFLTAAGPIIDFTSQFISMNPWVVKGVLGAAIGFTALRLAVWGTATAMKIFTGVTNLSPIGIAIRVIAMAAGFLIANWDKVAPFFKALWDKIKAPAQAVWNWLKDAFFSWHPLGIIIKNWEPIVDWFKDMWNRVKKIIEPIMNGIDKVKSVTSGITDTVSEKASSAWSGIKSFVGLGDNKPAPATAAPLRKEKTELNGTLKVEVNTTTGAARADLQTNQRDIKTSSKVGLSSLATGGAY